MLDDMIKISKDFIKYNLNFIVDNMKISVNHFTIETFDKIKGYAMHKHSSYELHYIKSGYGEVTFDDKRYQIEPGDLYLCAPNTPHMQLVYDGFMLEYAIRFDIEQLSNNKENTTVQESRSIISLLDAGSTHIMHNQIGIEQLFECTFNEAINKKAGYFIAIKQCITSIILETARSYNSIASNKLTNYNLPTKDIDTHRMDLINKYITDNIASNISNQDVASYTHMSIRQVYRVIKKNTGLSTHEYINSIKINRAKMLLHKKDKTLESIAQQLGYSSAFHLSTIFKKFTGYSPKQYIEVTKNLNTSDVSDKPDFSL